MKQPCKRDCPNRSATCHAECEKYTQYAEEMREEYKRRLAEAEVTCAVYEGRIRCGKYSAMN